MMTSLGYDILLDVQPATVDLGYWIFPSVPTSIGFRLAFYLLRQYPQYGKRLTEIQEVLVAKNARNE